MGLRASRGPSTERGLGHEGPSEPPGTGCKAHLLSLACHTAAGFAAVSNRPCAFENAFAVGPAFV